MLYPQILKDHFGQHYRIISRANPIGRLSYNPKSFSSTSSTLQFIRSLKVPLGYWARLINESSLQPRIRTNATFELENQVCQQLMSGRIKIVAVDIQTFKIGSVTKRTLKDNSGQSFLLSPAAAQLVHGKSDTQSFKDKDDAKQFLKKLNADDKQLATMAAELELAPPTSNAAATSEQLIDKISQAIVSGDVIVVADKSSAPPRSEEKTEPVTKDAPEFRQAGLGPEAGVLISKKPAVCGVCTASNLALSCSHSGRLIGNSKVIQIVPTPDRTASNKVSLLGVTVEVKRKYGGADSINGKLTLVGDKLGSCPKMRDEQGNWRNTNNLEVKIKAKDEDAQGLWVKNDSPKVYNIAGKGCAGDVLERKVEVYPSQYYSVEGKLDIFQQYVKEINKAWESWGKSIFNLSPVSLNPKLKGPAGSFEAGWGWKENDDWRSYFDVTASFGLNPILGVEIEISISMVKLAMTSAGIPPPLQSLTTEHLADLMVFGSAGCKGSLLGSPHAKFFTDNSDKIDGEAIFEIEGAVKLGLRGKVGSKYVVSAELILSGETKVKGKDKLELDSSGLYIQSNINMAPLEAVAKVVIKYLVVFSKTKEKKWNPWNEIELYKSEKRKLIPGE